MCGIATGTSSGLFVDCHPCLGELASRDWSADEDGNAAGGDLDGLVPWLVVAEDEVELVAEATADGVDLLGMAEIEATHESEPSADDSPKLDTQLQIRFFDAGSIEHALRARGDLYGAWEYQNMLLEQGHDSQVARAYMLRKFLPGHEVKMINLSGKRPRHVDVRAEEIMRDQMIEPPEIEKKKKPEPKDDDLPSSNEILTEHQVDPSVFDGKDCSQYEALRWAISQLAIDPRKVKAKSAPSAEAWSYYTNALSDQTYRRTLLSGVTTKLLPSQKDIDAIASQEDDGRRMLGLLSDLEDEAARIRESGDVTTWE
jgi:hypothetical protein